MWSARIRDDNPPAGTCSEREREREMESEKERGGEGEKEEWEEVLTRGEERGGGGM